MFHKKKLSVLFGGLHFGCIFSAFFFKKFLRQVFFCSQSRNVFVCWCKCHCIFRNWNLPLAGCTFTLLSEEEILSFWSIHADQLMILRAISEFIWNKVSWFGPYVMDSQQQIEHSTKIPKHSLIVFHFYLILQGFVWLGNCFSKQIYFVLDDLSFYSVFT